MTKFQVKNRIKGGPVAAREIALAASYAVEMLENRQMLSGNAWSQQDKQIGLDQAAANFPAITGAGGTVVVLDQGVDTSHPALAGKVVDSWNFDTNSASTYPSDGNVHGTGTVGEIAAAKHLVNGKIYQGVAPGVKIISLRANGTYNIKLALDWVLAHRVADNIVAMNFLDQSGADMSALQGDLQALNDSGVFVAGAVGNYGPGASWTLPGDVLRPVGSVNANDQLSSFSPSGSNLDFVAPGENIIITWSVNGNPTDVVSSGTSWAGPQITGAAALVKQVNPGFSSPDVYNILRDSATQIYDAASGLYYARLNVNAAIGLAYQRSGQSPTPVVTQAPVPTPTPAPAPAPTPTPVATPTPPPFKATSPTPAQATTVAPGPVSTPAPVKATPVSQTQALTPTPAKPATPPAAASTTTAKTATTSVTTTAATPTVAKTPTAATTTTTTKAATPSTPAATPTPVTANAPTPAPTPAPAPQPTVAETPVPKKPVSIKLIVKLARKPFFEGGTAPAVKTTTASVKGAATISASTPAKASATAAATASPVKAVATTPPAPVQVYSDGYAPGQYVSFAGYNAGGSGVGFYNGSSGVSTARSSSQSQPVVTNAQVGEWMNYTVNLATSGSYTFLVAAGSGGAGSAYHIEVDGQRVGSSTVAAAASTDSFVPQTAAVASLAAGKHVVRFVMDHASANGSVGNFAWFSFNTAAPARWA